MNCTSIVTKQWGRTLWRQALTALVLTGMAVTAGAQVPVTGGSASLKELVGSDTLVTIVLNVGNAQDRNVRIVDVGSDYISVIGPNGNRSSYLLSKVKEVRIQSGEVEVPRVRTNVARALNENEQAIVARAVEQLADIYDKSDADQQGKIATATLLVACSNMSSILNTSRDPDGNLKGKIDEAHQYLKDLAAANDDETAVDAAKALYQVGDTELVKPVVARGLSSPSRKARAKAAELAGLVKDTSVQSELLTMARGRSADLAAPAAYSLAQMGNKEVLPLLLSLITELNEEKGEAAAKGLVALGGPDVIKQLNTLVEGSEGIVKFRIALVLHRLNDPLGEELLRKEYLGVPSLARSAAIALARKGHPDGINYLRKKLDERFDQTESNYIFRAEAASAIIEGGDRSGLPKLQDTLRVSNPTVQIATCASIRVVGERFLLPVLMPALESSNPGVIRAASMAVIAIADPEFHSRVTDPNTLSYGSMKLELGTGAKASR